MFGTVVAIVVALVLVVLTGSHAWNNVLDGGSFAAINQTLPPIQLKSIWFPRHQSGRLAPVWPKVSGPACNYVNENVNVPAGGSVTVTSPNLSARRVRASYNLCGWYFRTVPGSSFTLACQRFSLSGEDTLYVSERTGWFTTNYRFQRKYFPSNLILFTRNVNVQFLYDRNGDRGSFSCTITASGVTPSTTSSPSIMSGSTPSASPSSSSTSSSSTPSSSTTSSSTTSSSTTSSSTTSSSTTSTSTSTTTVPSNESRCRCGIVNRTVRIVGGTNTQVNEYPWQVGIMSTTSRFVFCGGSLISDRYIVTAAHCMTGRTPTTFRLLLGGHTKNSPIATETIVNPIRIITHPQYQVGASNNNDISIIEIVPLDFTRNGFVVRPICLPDSAETYSGVMATVTGWGTLSSGGAQPNILQEVNIPVVTNTFCASVYGSSVISSNMICAGTTAGGTDSCQGDSGGPLIAPDGANYELIGVVSFGSGCGLPGVPGVYARVTALQSWIRSTTSQSTTCGR